MEVNFNNLRTQAAYALDNLTKGLNEGLLKNSDGSLVTEHVFFEDENGKKKWKKGNLLVDTDDIKKYMKELRSLVLTICSVYEPNDDKFKDMSEEIKENGGVAFFNPSE